MFLLARRLSVWLPAPRLRRVFSVRHTRLFGNMSLKNVANLNAVLCVSGHPPHNLTVAGTEMLSAPFHTAGHVHNSDLTESDLTGHSLESNKISGSSMNQSEQCCVVVTASSGCYVTESAPLVNDVIG